MGNDVFGALLYSFNGFPALPIFIGDYLLTQLKSYFYIPILIWSIIMAYHYISKGVNGGFKQIFIGGTASLTTVFIILQYSMPMEEYIRVYLGNTPKQVVNKPNETGEDQYVRTDIQLDVFKDVEHFAIINMMSTFISFSDVIANDLTRKIIYGTTDPSKITADTEMKGYFPSLIYGFKANRDLKAYAASAEAIKSTKIKDYFDKKDAINKNIHSEFKTLQSHLCKNLIGYSHTHSTDKVGLLNGKIYYSSCPEYDPKNSTTNTSGGGNTFAWELQALLSDALKSLDDINDVYKKDKGGDALSIKQNDTQKLYAAVLNSVNAKNLSKISSTIYPNSGSDERSQSLSHIVSKLKEFSSYYGDLLNEHDSINLIRIFLNNNYNEQKNKLKVLLDVIMKNVSKSTNSYFVSITEKYRSQAEGEEDYKAIPLLTNIIETLNSNRETIVKEVLNAISGTTNKTAQEITTVVVESQLKELYTQALRTAISLTAKYDIDMVVSELYPTRKQGNTPINKEIIDQLKKITGVTISDGYRDDTLKLIQESNKASDTISSTFLLQGVDKIQNRNVTVPLAIKVANSLEQRHRIRLFSANILQAMSISLATIGNEFDISDPFVQERGAYVAELNKLTAALQKDAIDSLNKKGNIKTLKGMIGVYNDMRPEGTYPIRGYERPISWLELGVFYTAFKTTYENSIRNAFIMSQVGKRQIGMLQSVKEMSDSLSKERVGATALGAGGVMIGADLMMNALNAYRDKNPESSKLTGFLMNSVGGTIKIVSTIIFVMMFVNILLPTGVWFIALVNYFIEISLYLAITPIALIFMIFQAYRGAIQKYINVLIMLLLYPSVLVSMFFIVLFLDMMLPIMLFNFIPFFNDASGIVAMVQTALPSEAGGFAGAMSDGIKTIAAHEAFNGINNVISLIVMMILSMFLSTYLIFMLLRAQSVLAQTLQGSGFNMMDSQGFSQDAEQKLKRMSGSGAVAGGSGLII